MKMIEKVKKPSAETIVTVRLILVLLSEKFSEAKALSLRGDEQDWWYDSKDFLEVNAGKIRRAINKYPDRFFYGEYKNGSELRNSFLLYESEGSLSMKIAKSKECALFWQFIQDLLSFLKVED